MHSPGFPEGLVGGEGVALRAANDCELETPVCFEARFSPLHPKLSAQLTMLAAGQGSLFAGQPS